MAFPPLMPQQAAASWFIQTRPNAGVFLDMSGGKSLAVLHALSQIKPVGHVLVIAPLKIARLTWTSEIERWGINVRARSLIVDEKDRKLSRSMRIERYRELLDPTTPPTMWFINREMLVDMISFFNPGINFSARYIRADRSKPMFWPFPTVIIDESQGFKSPSSKRFRALQTVRPFISRMILLSGTPIPNGLEDIWSQVWLLDMGQSLGRTFSEFHMRFFKSLGQLPGGPAIKWIPNDGADRIIHQSIAHLVMYAPTVTSKPMPNLNVIDYRVEMPPHAKDAYKTLLKDLIVDVALETDPNYQQGDHIDIASVSASNRGVLQNKLVQLASGTAYIDGEGDSGLLEELEGVGFDFGAQDLATGTRNVLGSNKREFISIHDVKLRALKDIVERTSTPVLVAYYFQSDCQLIVNFLTDLGYKPIVFDGSRGQYDAWNRREIPIMLIHPASSGHGLNLQDGGHTLIWYTLPQSLEYYMQTNKRLHRVGQQQDVDVYRILTEGTIDTKLPKILTQKADTQQELLLAVEQVINQPL